jgi:hypothetical protein
MIIHAASPPPLAAGTLRSINRECNKYPEFFLQNATVAGYLHYYKHFFWNVA